MDKIIWKIDMPNQLTVNKILNGENLTLDVGQAIVRIDNNILEILVNFPEKYGIEDRVWDETGNHIISEPIDYFFKETEAFLELEIPMNNVLDLDSLLDKSIIIHSDKEDGWTNFLINENHFPTFNDEIVFRKKEGNYYLNWIGYLPNINYWDFEKAMKQKFKFELRTIIVIE